MTDVTRLLEAAHRGDQHAAGELLPPVYDELRKLAAAKLAHEKPGQTLNATALVHEAYLRLVGDQQFDGRGHFFAAAAEAIRRILVEQARRRQASRHGGGRQRQHLDPDRLAAPAPDGSFRHQLLPSTPLSPAERHRRRCIRLSLMILESRQK